MNGGISGNAGVFSCADDIAILCAALQNGGEWNGRRILSPLGVKAMRTVPRTTASLGRTLGWDNFTAYASNNGDCLVLIPMGIPATRVPPSLSIRTMTLPSYSLSTPYIRKTDTA